MIAYRAKAVNHEPLIKAYFSQDRTRSGRTRRRNASAGRTEADGDGPSRTGNSGVQVTRLAFGTGSFSGEVQRSLGQQGFTTLVRYAYDQGIRFFETSESYGDMHRMLGVALQGLPRESYRLMSKVTTRDGVDPAAQAR